MKDLLSDAGRRSCLKALNREGATPLHVAVQAGLLDVAQLLVNAGAKVDATDRVSVALGGWGGGGVEWVLQGSHGPLLVNAGARMDRPTG